MKCSSNLSRSNQESKLPRSWRRKSHWFLAPPKGCSPWHSRDQSNSPANWSRHRRFGKHPVLTSPPGPHRFESDDKGESLRVGWSDCRLIPSKFGLHLRFDKLPGMTQRVSIWIDWG